MTTPMEPTHHCDIHEIDFWWPEMGGCPDCVEAWSELEEEEEDATAGLILLVCGVQYHPSNPCEGGIAEPIKRGGEFTKKKNQKKKSLFEL